MMPEEQFRAKDSLQGDERQDVRKNGKKKQRRMGCVKNCLIIEYEKRKPLIEIGGFRFEKSEEKYEKYEKVSCCILQSPADSDAFQSGRCAKHNGRPETMYF